LSTRAFFVFQLIKFSQGKVPRKQRRIVPNESARQTIALSEDNKRTPFFTQECKKSLHF